MSQQTFRNIEPIRPGYDSYIRITYTQEFWDAVGMDTGRFVAQFRDEIESTTVLFEADTVDSTITMDDVNHKVVIELPGASTAAWTVNKVMFDIIKIDGSTHTPVPGIWRWPVSHRVTRDVV